MVRICVLTQAIQSLGGVQRVVSTMMNSIANDPNYEVYIYTPMVNDTEELFKISSKIKILNSYKFKKKSKLSARIMKKISRNTSLFLNFPKLMQRLYFSEEEVNKLCEFVKSEKIDLVVGTDPFYSVLAAILSSKVENLKAIAWMHSTFEAYFFQKDRPTYSMQKLFSMYSEYFDRVLVLTEADRITYSEYLSGIKERIIVFNNPVTVTVKELSALQPNRLLYIGRVTQEKGCDLLLEIAKKLKQCKCDFVLDVVGNGPYFKKLQRLVEKNSLQRNVILHGVSNNVEKYYTQASMVLVTSKYEGFGLIITEAMSYGIPVIAFHAQGPDEIIKDGESGFLISQFDCDQYVNSIIQLMDDRKLLLSMSSQALKRSKQYSLEKVVKDFKNIVEECIFS